MVRLPPIGEIDFKVTIPIRSDLHIFLFMWLSAEQPCYRVTEAGSLGPASATPPMVMLPRRTRNKAFENLRD